MKPTVLSRLRLGVAAWVGAALCTPGPCSPTLDAIRMSAASPTLDAIRMSRSREPRPSIDRAARPIVTPVRFTRYRGRMTSVVRVVARDPRVARLEARVAALRQSIQEQVRARRADQSSRKILAERVKALSDLLASRQDQL